MKSAQISTSMEASKPPNPSESIQRQREFESICDKSLNPKRFTTSLEKD